MSGSGRWNCLSRARLLDILAVLASSSIVFIGLVYAQVVRTYDLTTLLVSVVIPLVFGVAVFSVRKNRVLLFSFLALIWAVVDDAPVYFDSVLTWPEVTRFHPFIPRLEMNLVIHLLTLLFLYLAMREALKGTGVGLLQAPGVVVLAFLAFVFAYAQNIPLLAVQLLVANFWYPFDLVEKLLSIFFIWLAVKEAGRLEPGAPVVPSGQGIGVAPVSEAAGNQEKTGENAGDRRTIENAP